MRKTLAWLLIVAVILNFCACTNTPETEAVDSLDFDYVESYNAGRAEKSPVPWYAWFVDAFSFGSANDGMKQSTAMPENTPDSVQEFYQQGTAPTERPKVMADASQSPNVTPFRPEPTPSLDAGEVTPAPEQATTPAPNVTPMPTPKGNIVTMHIRCDTAVNNGMHLESKWAGIVPASGVILPVTTVEIEEGDTVFDVLAFVCEKHKIHMSYRGGTSSGCYVEGINNLYEFDGGRWSGWMYCVNDWYPNYGCSRYQVKDGDVVEWRYTCDLGEDLGSGMGG